MNLFYCIDKCTTCRAARRDLQERGIDFVIRDLKTDPPTADELRQWALAHPRGIQAFLNTSGILYRERNLKEKRLRLSEQELLEMLSGEGMLIKRPILVTPGGVLVGYSAEAYEAFFGK